MNKQHEIYDLQMPQLNAPIEKLMMKTIHEQYGGISDNNIYTFSWNLVMLRVGLTDIHRSNSILYYEVYSDKHKLLKPLKRNFLTFQFECCGAVSYMDFRENMQKTQPWPKNDTVPIRGHNVTDTFDMPVVCCKTNGTFPNLEFYDQTCYKESSPSNNRNMVSVWAEERHSCWSELILSLNNCWNVKYASLNTLYLFMC